MKRIFTSLLILMAASMFAQQDPMYSQYMFNKLAVNPGYAGSRDLLTSDLLYRYQWVNFDGAPKTISASLHSPLNNPHLALGAYVYNDQIGPLSYTGALGTFAYRIILPQGKLSFGLQGGFKNNNIVSEFNAKDSQDPLLTENIEKKLVPDASFGVYYYSDNFYAGLSSLHLLQNQSLMVRDASGNVQFTKLLAHFYAMTGAAIPLSENVVFRPSLLAKFVNNAPPQLDVNASFLFANVIWLGASYRTEKAVAFITEINIAQNFRVGYSYDIWFNELKVYNKGSHEIRLSFDINVGRRILSPRYF